MRTRTTQSIVMAAALALATTAFAGAQPATTQRALAAEKQEASAEAHHHKLFHHHMKLSKNDVMAVQNALARSGQYKGRIDGVMGKETREALRAYQKENGLKVTGNADSETLKRLGVERKANPQPAKKSESSKGTSARPATKQ